MKAGDVDVDLDRCVRFAIAKGVKHLDLRGGRSNYVFPHDSVSDFGGFSQLVTLHLCDVVIHPSFTSNLSSIFASLESLTLHDVGVRNDLDTITDMNIVAGDRLTDLKVRYCEGKIKISARNLASLEYVGGYFSSLTINTPSLAIDLLEMHQQRLLMSPDLLMQLGTCSNVESLCMRMEPESLVNFKMPAFGNLRKLEMDICSSRYRYNNNDDNLFGFLDFLKAAPLLEELVTALLIRHLKFTDERQIRSVSAGFTHDNLKIFKMKNFHTHWSEIEFAFCILKYARNLKVMEIGPFAERDFVDRTKVNYYREEVKYPAGCMLSENANGKQMLFDLIHFMSKEVEEVKTDAQIVLLTSLPTCAKKVRQNDVSNSFHLLAQACSTK